MIRQVGEINEDLSSQDRIEKVAEAIFDATMKATGREWPRWRNGATPSQKEAARSAALAAIRATAQ